jgi:hypothetical protein
MVALTLVAGLSHAYPVVRAESASLIAEMICADHAHKTASKTRRDLDSGGGGTADGASSQSELRPTSSDPYGSSSLRRNRGRRDAGSFRPGSQRDGSSYIGLTGDADGEDDDDDPGPGAVELVGLLLPLLADPDDIVVMTVLAVFRSRPRGEDSDSEDDSDGEDVYDTDPVPGRSTRANTAAGLSVERGEETGGLLFFFFFFFFP